MTQGMPDEPASILGEKGVVASIDFPEPFLADVESNIRMVLGNVPKVVRNGSSDIGFRIILEDFEKLK